MQNDLVIYEMNVRAFTDDKSSGLDSSIRGSYLGVIEKVSSAAEEVSETCFLFRLLLPCFFHSLLCCCSLIVTCLYYVIYRLLKVHPSYEGLIFNIL